MLSCFSRVQLFETPWTVTCQVPLTMEFSRPEYWSGLPFHSPGNVPHPRDWTRVSCIAGRVFTIWVTREAHIKVCVCINVCVYICVCVYKWNRCFSFQGVVICLLLAFGKIAMRHFSSKWAVYLGAVGGEWALPFPPFPGTGGLAIRWVPPVQLLLWSRTCLWDCSDLTRWVKGLDRDIQLSSFGASAEIPHLPTGEENITFSAAVEGAISTPMGVCVCAKSLQPCLTLCNHLDCSLPGSSVHGFSRQEYWSGSPPPGDLPDPGIEPMLLPWQTGSLLLVPPGKHPSPILIHSKCFLLPAQPTHSGIPKRWKTELSV